VIIRDENLEEKSDVITELSEIGIRVKALRNLHAKIYLSDKGCIISSMNLYDYSAANNEEIAIKITDQDSLQEIRKYVKDLSDRSKDIEIKKLSTSDRFSKRRDTYGQKLDKIDKKGYCIRCKRKIKLNPDKPLCLECYDEWSFYENPTYKENYCHICGISEGTSMKKPVCRSCYKKTS
jgi:RNA polymerase-binding transcription factor DksA